MVGLRLFNRSIGLISMAVLARLLLPDDFGLMAMAMAVIAFVDVLTSFGFELKLIQSEAPQREHFDTAWSLNLCLAVATALVIISSASAVATFYGDPRLAAVMVAIGIARLFAGFENIGVVHFRRDLNFAAEFRYLASRRLVGFAVAMASAFIMRDYWALVIGAAASRLVGVPLSYYMHPFRPRFTFARARELMSFSGWVLVNQTLGEIMNRAPHIIVGRLYGTQAVGAYTVAAEVSLLAQTELIAPINRAMFPGYSRLTTDPAQFRRTCIDATAMILLIALPICVGIGVLAPPLVRLLLGEQWATVVPIIQVLAAAGAVGAVTSNTMSICLAIGKLYLFTSILAARGLMLAAALFILGTDLGTIGVALADLIGAVASLTVSIPILAATVGFSLRHYLSIFWRPAIACALMGWIVHAVVNPSFQLDHEGAAAAELLLGAGIGSVLYPLTLALLWWLSGKPESVELQLAQRGWAELRSRLGRT